MTTRTFTRIEAAAPGPGHEIYVSKGRLPVSQTIEQAFLADILTHPDDDTPRLIYADWLDDHGEPDWAEFIRVQCELARDFGIPPSGKPLVTGDAIADARERDLRQREAVLIGEMAWAWSKLPIRRAYPVGTHRPNGLVFRRGFVESLTLPAADWLTHADTIVAVTPLREVRLTTWPAIEQSDTFAERLWVRFTGRYVEVEVTQDMIEQATWEQMRPL